jgi:NADH dehydrogenase/NADH:ubiquinone oxidoreductase subunit G
MLTGPELRTGGKEKIMANQKNESSDKSSSTESRQSIKANGQDTSGGSDSTLLSQAKTAAGDVYGTVADKAAATIDEQKAGLTGKLSGVAETVRRVGGTLHEGEADSSLSEYAARYTDTAAEKLESVAKYFDKADLSDIARDVETYARRNPAVFLGAAFALGIAAARFLKSSPPADSTATSSRELTGDQPVRTPKDQSRSAGAAPSGF